MDHIGIDVHKRDSQIYILAEGGEVIEQRIRTEAERFAAVLGTRPRARILIEASTDSEWVARCLEALGHEVIVADPNFAPMYATRTRKAKTDRRDARALAEACLLGAYRPAHRLSDSQRHVRGRLGVRDALVQTRTRYISVIRALLRQQGYRVPSGSAGSFVDRVQALPLPGRLLSVVAPLLAVMRPLNRQLAYSDAAIEHLHPPSSLASRGAGPAPARSVGRERPPARDPAPVPDHPAPRRRQGQVKGNGRSGFLTHPRSVDGRPSRTTRGRPHCGGRLRLIATLHDPAVIRKILTHLGIAPFWIAPLGPSPGPALPEPAAAPRSAPRGCGGHRRACAARRQPR